MSIESDPRSGRPRTSTDERSVKLVTDALEEDRRATCEELSRATGVPVTSVFRILTKHLMKGYLMVKVCVSCMCGSVRKEGILWRGCVRI